MKIKTTQENNGEKLTATGNNNRNSLLKRDVEEMSGQVMNGLEGQRVQQHFYKTLRKYGINSGLAVQLHYNNSYHARTVFHDHDYCKNVEEFYDKNVLSPRFENVDGHDVWHSNLSVNYSSEGTEPDAVIVVKETVDLEDNIHILMHEHQQKEVMHLLDLLQDTKESKIKVSLPKYNRLDSSGFNYVSVKQGSTQWHALRVGIITASKIPYLLGFHGQKEFEHAWLCVHNKIDELLSRDTI